jgi:hypothetical protein
MDLEIYWEVCGLIIVAEEMDKCWDVVVTVVDICLMSCGEFSE